MGTPENKPGSHGARPRAEEQVETPFAPAVQEELDSGDDQADAATHASTNFLYREACKLDRGHADDPTWLIAPPGASLEGAPQAETHASDAATHVSDTEDVLPDVQTHASEACAPEGDAVTRASE